MDGPWLEAVDAACQRDESKKENTYGSKHVRSPDAEAIIIGSGGLSTRAGR